MDTGEGGVMDTLTKILNGLVKRGMAPAMVNDDNGRWTILGDGFQPAEGGPGYYTWLIDEDQKWYDTPLKAAKAALEDLC